MQRVSIRVLGCGDAFGSGGRMQTSFFVSSGGDRFLIDCGASALVAMRRYEVEPETIDAVLLSHLHGDHFGGLPFLLLQAHYIARRTRPLIIAGPAGTEARLLDALEVLFPGSSELQWRFPLDFVELRPDEATQINAITVRAFPVEHPSGAPSLGLRIGLEGRVIGYSGDTRWTGALVDVAREADLFLCECYGYNDKIDHHLNYTTLMARLPELRPKRLVLTHMSDAMLARLDQAAVETAEDGMLLEV